MLREGKETAPGQGPTRFIPGTAQGYNAIGAQGIRQPAHRRFWRHYNLMREEIRQISKRHRRSRHAEMLCGTAQAVFQGAINKTLHQWRGAKR
jgi:hypothetical protein